MGGAAGHMNHPFDLGWVNTGNDLLDFFERAATFVEKEGAGAVKIDGETITDPGHLVTLGEGKQARLSLGKKKHAIIRA